MKIKVFEKPEPAEEPEMFLTLEQEPDKIFLKLVDKYGKPIDGGILLEVNSNMEIRRIGYINEELGLPLNAENKLKIAGVDD